MTENTHSNNNRYYSNKNKNYNHNKKKTYYKKPYKKYKKPYNRTFIETTADIKRDILRVEKEIRLEIEEIKAMRI